METEVTEKKKVRTWDCKTWSKAFIPGHLRLIVRGKAFQLPMKEIVRLDARTKYTDVVTAAGTYLYSHTLSFTVDKVKDYVPMARYHLSHAVNLHTVETIDPTYRHRWLVLKDDTLLVVAQRRMKEVQKQWIAYKERLRNEPTYQAGV